MAAASDATAAHARARVLRLEGPWGDASSEGDCQEIAAAWAEGRASRVPPVQSRQSKATRDGLYGSLAKPFLATDVKKPKVRFSNFETGQFSESHTRECFTVDSAHSSEGAKEELMAIGDISVGICGRGDKASEGEMADGHFGSSARSASTPRHSVRASDRRPTTASRLLIQR